MLEEYTIKTGILSNSAWTGAVLEGELARHNLDHRFSFLVASADYGFRKPHNRIFKLAVKKMNLQPEDIWFIGDKTEYDIRGAIDFGLYPVWYNRKNDTSRIDGDYLEIRHWNELEERIRSLYTD